MDEMEGFVFSAITPLKLDTNHPESSWYVGPHSINLSPVKWLGDIVEYDWKDKY